jgi:PPM family protein phosphatase
MLPKMEIAHAQGAGETHRGGRSSNQDTLVMEPGLGLYAVLDGMGGAAAGDVASRLASEELIHFVRRHAGTGRFSPRELLEFAIDHAAVAVFQAARQQPGCEGMGTTVVACMVVDSTTVVVGHAGDSRAYLLRAGCLKALTVDHTVAQRMVDDGDMTVEVAERSWLRHHLTRNLGAKHGVCPDILEQTLEPGDRLLLCSDGLYGSVSPEDINHVLGSSDAPDGIAARMIEMALIANADDNVSAVVIELKKPALVEPVDICTTAIAELVRLILVLKSTNAAIDYAHGARVRRELERDLREAQQTFEALPEGPARTYALRRLDGLRTLANGQLAIAPNPSAAAIAAARAGDPSVWFHEADKWAMDRLGHRSRRPQAPGNAPGSSGNADTKPVPLADDD